MAQLKKNGFCYRMGVGCANFLEENKGFKYYTLSSKKLVDTGFKYKYELEEMFDGAIDQQSHKRDPRHFTRLNSQTMRRLVYISSGSTILFQEKELGLLDESLWSDLDFIRTSRPSGATYYISKALTEKAALDFANENGLEFVTIVPTYIHGLFITPQCPDLVRASLAMIYSHS
ncbi:hypothetical protein LguiB_023573 [Lonicera macranthoides]